MIEPLRESASPCKKPLTEIERIGVQVFSGDARIGPEAARLIARRIEDQGGFWSFRTAGAS